MPYSPQAISSPIGQILKLGSNRGVCRDLGSYGTVSMDRRLEPQRDRAN
jgi:hypothetical protein